ncbi:MAG: DUF4870 domain-containing protein [Bdellovibrionales bacterium]|nr:DUF4870 domain-containing protein [Bdellovibrionales bacterium]
MEQFQSRALSVGESEGSRGGYLIALLLFVVCTVLGVGEAIESGSRLYGAPAFEFLAPGTHSIAVTESGNYTLWNDASTTFEGKVFRSSETLPSDFDIEVRAPNGVRVPLIPQSGATVRRGDAHARYAIGTFTFDTPGTYQVITTGSFSTRVLSIRRAIFRELWVAMGTVGVWLFGGWILAPGIALVTWLKKKAEPAQRSGAVGAERWAPPGPPVGTSGAVVSDEERSKAVLLHLSALAGFIVPLASVIGPLLLWLRFRSQSLFLDRHGKEAVNFQVSMLLYGIVSLLLLLVLIGLVLLVALWLIWIVLVIAAVVKAGRGEEYRYPLSIRFLR